MNFRNYFKAAVFTLIFTGIILIGLKYTHGKEFLEYAANLLTASLKYSGLLWYLIRQKKCSMAMWNI